MFLSWMEEEGCSSRYIYETKLSLRLWSGAIAQDLDDPDLIQRTLDKRPTRARPLLSALKKYGEYRNILGDSRLLIVLATSRIKLPSYAPKSKVLNLSEAQMFANSARDLCQKGDRLGIWIGLSWLGVKPSEMANVQPGRSARSSIVLERRKGMVKIAAPAWLVQAMETIPEKRWRLGRHIIHREMKQQYGINPQTIHRSALHISSSDPDSP